MDSGDEQLPGVRRGDGDEGGGVCMNGEKGDQTAKKVIVKNMIRCKLCGDIIESKHRHDYVECRCGACAVDGGHDYLRRCFKEKDCYIDLSETEEAHEEE